MLVRLIFTVFCTMQQLLNPARTCLAEVQREHHAHLNQKGTKATPWKQEQ
jgi:hypothetical protein